MGISTKSFAHYAFDAGENKGEAPTFFSKSELSRALNVENRANGLEPRFGSSVLNVDPVTGYPTPISGNPIINDIFGITYGSSGFETLFTASDKIYLGAVTPTAIKTGLSVDARFQGEQVGDFFYLTNGVDPVQFFDPNRSLAQTYTAGYDTPAAFTATPSALGGSMTTGTYEYYVVLYDLTTETKSNRQAVAVSAAVVGPTGSVALTNLPLDPENRSTHWIIYRKDPTGYYHYKLVTIAYNAASPIYTDTFILTGAAEIAPNDNDKPDVSSVICQHGNVMVYALGDTITWSKNFRYQNVPTYNREPLIDSSTSITRMISYRKALVIWKTGTMYVIRGDLNGAYTVDKISGELGTLSPKTVQEGPDGIYFLDSKKKPRLINSTDFDSEDLRESTDISYKFRKRFGEISEDALPYCFAVLWDTSLVSEYRLFVPVDTSSLYPNHCYVYDYALSKRNRGDSSWFDFRYNWNLSCAVKVAYTRTQRKLYAGNDYGQILELEVPNQFFDGDEVIRVENSGTVTFGVNTIDCSSLTMGIDQFVGMQLILFNQYTYQEIFRSRITTNTATQFTVEDAIPTLPTTNPFLTVGGYLTYFATAHYTNKRADVCAPFKASVLFGIQYSAAHLQFFTHYDFNDVFNFNYDYINTPANPSLTPLADNYDIVIGQIFSLYDAALYNVGTYGGVLYDTAEFFLNSKYYFKHVSWGVITREPSSPFSYLGATYFYQPEGLAG